MEFFAHVSPVFFSSCQEIVLVQSSHSAICPGSVVENLQCNSKFWKNILEFNILLVL